MPISNDHDSEEYTKVLLKEHGVRNLNGSATMFLWVCIHVGTYVCVCVHRETQIPMSEREEKKGRERKKEKEGKRKGDKIKAAKYWKLMNLSRNPWEFSVLLLQLFCESKITSTSFLKVLWSQHLNNRYNPGYIKQKHTVLSWEVKEIHEGTLWSYHSPTVSISHMFVAINTNWSIWILY